MTKRELNSTQLILVSSLKEANGNTVYENNMERKHAIPIGTLVEESCTGIRLFVVRHERDCDGTPLYGLSFDLEAENRRRSVSDSELLPAKFLCWRHTGSIMDGVSEDSIVVVKEHV